MVIRQHTKSPKDGATRQEEWRKREEEKGRTRRFDRKVTPDEYDVLDKTFKNLRGIQ